MTSEDLLKKAIAAFKALSPEQQAEMLEEQRQSWVRGNVGLSRDERGMPPPVAPVSPDATDCPACGGTGQMGPFFPGGLSTICGNCHPAPDATGKCGELVTVKPLEWRKYRNGDAEVVTPFGEIYTAYVNGYWRITRNGKAGKFIKATGGDDVDAAKAGAQADFEANVLPLVRSQAVELLAAKDDHITWLTNHLEAAEGRARNAAANSAKFEELLAAERAEKEEARQAWKEAVAMYEQEKARVDPALKHVSDLEADNAALTARIKELEDKRVEDRFTVVDEIEKREALEAKLAAAEKALEPFADIAEWDIGDSEADDDIYRPMDGRYATAKLIRVGDLRKARAVLGGKPS